MPRDSQTVLRRHDSSQSSAATTSDNHSKIPLIALINGTSMRWCWSILPDVSTSDSLITGGLTSMTGRYAPSPVVTKSMFGNNFRRSYIILLIIALCTRANSSAFIPLLWISYETNNKSSSWNPLIYASTIVLSSVLSLLIGLATVWSIRSLGASKLEEYNKNSVLKKRRQWRGKKGILLVFQLIRIVGNLVFAVSNDTWTTFIGRMLIAFSTSELIIFSMIICEIRDRKLMITNAVDRVIGTINVDMTRIMMESENGKNRSCGWQAWVEQCIGDGYIFGWTLAIGSILGAIVAAVSTYAGQWTWHGSTFYSESYYCCGFVFAGWSLINLILILVLHDDLPWLPEASILSTDPVMNSIISNINFVPIRRYSEFPLSYMSWIFRPYGPLVPSLTYINGNHRPSGPPDVFGMLAGVVLSALLSGAFMSLLIISPPYATHVLGFSTASLCWAWTVACACIVMGIAFTCANMRFKHYILSSTTCRLCLGLFISTIVSSLVFFNEIRISNSYICVGTCVMFFVFGVTDPTLLESYLDKLGSDPATMSLRYYDSVYMSPQSSINVYHVVYAIICVLVPIFGSLVFCTHHNEMDIAGGSSSHPNIELTTSKQARTNTVAPMDTTNIALSTFGMISCALGTAFITAFLLRRKLAVRNYIKLAASTGSRSSVQTDEEEQLDETEPSTESSEVSSTQSHSFVNK